MGSWQSVLVANDMTPNDYTTSKHLQDIQTEGPRTWLPVLEKWQDA